MPKRLNYNFVKSKFEERGYELLSEEYARAKDKLEYKCPAGHNGYMRFSDFLQGYGCKQCVIENQRLSFEHVEKKFKKRCVMS